MTVQPPSNQPTVPSTPDPTIKDMVYEAIQDGLMIAGGLGVPISVTLKNPQVEMAVASGVAGLIGLGMSIYDQWRKARAAHASAVASARMNVPRRVV